VRPPASTLTGKAKVTSKTRLSHWNEREGRHGLTIFTFTETEWHNQDGELVKRRISTGVRY